jgi:ATP-dependent exoDNAse (exonuclease V) alpha subunit
VRSQNAPALSEDEIRRYEDLQKHTKEYIHGMLAVEAGKLKHVLPEENNRWICGGDTDVKLGTDEDIHKMERWKTEMERLMQEEIGLDAESSNDHDRLDEGGDVLPIQELLSRVSSTSNTSDDNQQTFGEGDVTCLNEEQRRAFDIVNWHLQKTLAGEQPPQLRMLITGEGGTGKSRVIQAITANFESHHVGDILVKGAYTGIAASIIDGRTLHVLTAMPLKGVRSAKTMKKLATFWKKKKYLIIDEVSMLSRQFLAKLSKIITTVFSCNENGDSNLPFGGINVVLVGDFHQFPPVISGRAAPLYYPNNPLFDNAEALIKYDSYFLAFKTERRIGK